MVLFDMKIQKMTGWKIPTAFRAAIDMCLLIMHFVVFM